jgi:hypothetical protein
VYKLAFGIPAKKRAVERPKNLNVRLTIDEWEDVRKIAIAEDVSLTELVRLWIDQHKVKLIKEGRFPSESER